jgi:glycosyltransferase involved in cell wall biosynthesis
MKMRFCMVTTFYPPYHFGGDAIFIQQLSNELAQRGHHVEVVHCQDAYQVLSGARQSAPYQDHPNVTVHGLKSSAGFLSPLITQQTGSPGLKASRLRSLLEQPFDVIHFHNISLVGGPKVLEYGRAVKLYTLHEYWLVCPTHMLFKFDQEVCTEQSCIACMVAHRRPPQLWRYTRMIEAAAQHVDMFIAPSSFCMQKHREMGLQRPMVELPYFTSRWSHDEQIKTYITREPPYFLFVGRLEKLKGLQTIIPIFRRYEKARLLVAGTGDYEEVLRTMAAGSPNITFLGHQSGEQLRQLYEQAVAIIVPSIWYEVFGIIILESFARATPAIVRNIGAMPKIIEESSGGFVFNTDQELLHAMDQLIEDPSLRDKLGRQGNAALRQKWTAEVHIPCYIGHAERVLESRLDQRRGKRLSF